MTFAQQLDAMLACDEILAWVGGRDLATSWRECERADWLAWLAARAVDHKTIVEALCDAADLATKNVEPGPLLDAIQKCIGTTRAWTRGESTISLVLLSQQVLLELPWHAAAKTAAYAAIDTANAALAAVDATGAAAAAARVVGHPAVCAALRARITSDMVAAGLAARGGR